MSHVHAWELVMLPGGGYISYDMNPPLYDFRCACGAVRRMTADDAVVSPTPFAPPEAPKGMPSNVVALARDFLTHCDDPQHPAHQLLSSETRAFAEAVVYFAAPVPEADQRQEERLRELAKRAAQIEHVSCVYGATSSNGHKWLGGGDRWAGYMICEHPDCVLTRTPHLSASRTSEPTPAEQFRQKTDEARQAEKKCRDNCDELGAAYHDGRADAYDGALGILEMANSASVTPSADQEPPDTKK